MTCKACSFPHQFAGNYCPQCGANNHIEPEWCSKAELEAELLYTLLKDEANPLEAFKKMQQESREMRGLIQ